MITPPLVLLSDFTPPKVSTSHILNRPFDNSIYWTQSRIIANRKENASLDIRRYQFLLCLASKLNLLERYYYKCLGPCLERYQEVILQQNKIFVFTEESSHLV